MQKRIDGLARAWRLHEQLQSLSDWRIEQLVSQRRSPELARKEILEALSGDFPCPANLSRLLTARLVRFDREIIATTQAEENELRRRQLAATRAKSLKRRVDALDAEMRARQERSLPLDAIEAWLSSQASSSVQA